MGGGRGWEEVDRRIEILSPGEFELEVLSDPGEMLLMIDLLKWMCVEIVSGRMKMMDPEKEVAIEIETCRRERRDQRTDRRPK